MAPPVCHGSVLHEWGQGRAWQQGWPHLPLLYISGGLSSHMNASPPSEGGREEASESLHAGWRRGHGVRRHSCPTRGGLWNKKPELHVEHPLLRPRGWCLSLLRGCGMHGSRCSQIPPQCPAHSPWPTPSGCGTSHPLLPTSSPPEGCGLDVGVQCLGVILCFSFPKRSQVQCLLLTSFVSG